MKTSIKIRKFYYADVAEDGGMGTNWKSIQSGQRESTVQLNGSDADTTNYKNVEGAILESAKVKGDKTLVFQLADLDPSVVAEFTGGVVTSTTDSDRYDTPENENQSIEKSFKFLTESYILFSVPRASVDAFLMTNDDDLHYLQVNTVVMKPEKEGLSSLSYDVLKAIGANDITSFILAEQTGDATITPGTHTVSIEVANGTDVTTLAPTIGLSLGASVSPGSDTVVDFTNPVTFTVEAADGTKQDWVVTVTVAA